MTELSKKIFSLSPSCNSDELTAQIDRPMDKNGRMSKKPEVQLRICEAQKGVAAISTEIHIDKGRNVSFFPFFSPWLDPCEDPCGVSEKYRKK